MRTVHEQERQGEGDLEQQLLPQPPEPPEASDPVRTGVDELTRGAAAEAGEPLSAHQHRVRRVRAAMHARRERIRADTHKNRVYRGVVGAFGSFVVVLGLILVPLPGPGWLVVFLGLAVLGTEFSSAQRLKHFGERQVHRWAQWVADRSLATRAVLGTGTVAVVAAVVWGYLAWQGLPSWTPEVVVAQLQWVPGL